MTSCFARSSPFHVEAVLTNTADIERQILDRYLRGLAAALGPLTFLPLSITEPRGDVGAVPSLNEDIRYKY